MGTKARLNRLLDVEDELLEVEKKAAEEGRKERDKLSKLVEEDDRQKFVKSLIDQTTDPTFEDWPKIEEKLNKDCEEYHAAQKKKVQDQLDEWKKEKKEIADKKEEDRCVTAIKDLLDEKKNFELSKWDEVEKEVDTESAKLLPNCRSQREQKE